MANIPVDELAMLYLEKRGGLSTPEEFVDAFVQVRDAMSKHVKETAEEPLVYAPPTVCTRPSKFLNK